MQRILESDFLKVLHPDIVCSIFLDRNEGQQVQVRMQLLPPEIANETPLSILFIGKAVRVLQPQSGGLPADQLGAAAVLDRLQAAPAFDAGEFESAVESIRSQVLPAAPAAS